MKNFSSAINRIGTESAFAVGPEITYWQKKGFDIVKLNIGEPGCSIPEASTRAAVASFRKHETHYTASAGSESLREEIAGYMTATRRVKYQASDIIATPGGKPVIAGTIFILADPSDEVIYPTPGYPIYESIIDYIGAKRVPIKLHEDKGFRFEIKDLKKFVSRKTKLLILNSPSNPTGGVLEEEDMKEIAALAEKYDFYILSDECYSRLAFGKDHRHPDRTYDNGFLRHPDRTASDAGVEGSSFQTGSETSSLKQVIYKGNKFMITPSIASQKGMAERTVVLDAFSKTYAMTGLRIGFAASKNKEFMDKFLTYAINFWSCLPSPVMAAAEAALGRDQSEAGKEIALYKKKRDAAVSLLRKIKGIKCHNPVGSFYLFPNVTAVCKKLKLKDAEAFRKYLLSYDRMNKKGVAVLSREHFGHRQGGEKEEYIRISFAGKLSDIKEGIKRIKQAVE